MELMLGLFGLGIFISQPILRATSVKMYGWMQVIGEVITLVYYEAVFQLSSNHHRTVLINKAYTNEDLRQAESSGQYVFGSTLVALFDVIVTFEQIQLMDSLLSERQAALEEITLEPENGGEVPQEILIERL